MGIFPGYKPCRCFFSYLRTITDLFDLNCMKYLCLLTVETERKNLSSKQTRMESRILAINRFCWLRGLPKRIVGIFPQKAVRVESHQVHFLVMCRQLFQNHHLWITWLFSRKSTIYSIDSQLSWCRIIQFNITYFFLHIYNINNLVSCVVAFTTTSDSGIIILAQKGFFLFDHGLYLLAAALYV